MQLADALVDQGIGQIDDDDATEGLADRAAVEAVDLALDALAEHALDVCSKLGEGIELGDPPGKLVVQRRELALLDGSQAQIEGRGRTRERRGGVVLGERDLDRGLFPRPHPDDRLLHLREDPASAELDVVALGDRAGQIAAVGRATAEVELDEVARLGGAIGDGNEWRSLPAELLELALDEIVRHRVVVARRLEHERIRAGRPSDGSARSPRSGTPRPRRAAPSSRCRAARSASGG